MTPDWFYLCLAHVFCSNLIWFNDQCSPIYSSTYHSKCYINMFLFLLLDFRFNSLIIQTFVFSPAVTTWCCCRVISQRGSLQFPRIFSYLTVVIFLKSTMSQGSFHFHSTAHKNDENQNWEKITCTLSNPHLPSVSFHPPVWREENLNGTNHFLKKLLNKANLFLCKSWYIDKEVQWYSSCFISAFGAATFHHCLDTGNTSIHLSDTNVEQQ